MENKRQIETLEIDEVGDNHHLTSIETPLHPDAFKLDDDLKIELIAKNFREIMHVLGLDLNDESLNKTLREELQRCM